MDGVDLKFDNDAIDLIAKEALKRKTGARALKSIVEEIMLDIMYNVPTQDIKEYIVTADLVKAKTSKLAPLVKLPTNNKINEDIA